MNKLRIVKLTLLVVLFTPAVSQGDKGEIDLRAAAKAARAKHLPAQKFIIPAVANFREWSDTELSSSLPVETLSLIHI